MRSKAPLAMMEQMVMLLVFALAAALCLQAFVKSDEMSRRSEDRDRAMVLCQNMAEAIRHSGGDFPETLRQITGAAQPSSAALENELLATFDVDWEPPVATAVAYQLRARRMDSGIPGLGKAAVWVETFGDEPETLFEIEVAWQEVSAHG